MANMAMDILNSTKLSIYCYNLKGINQDRFNLPKIPNFHENFIGYGIYALNNVISKGILSGRSYGVVVTLIHSSLADRVVCLKCEERVVVITLCNVMFINLYMPCSTTADNISIVQSIIYELGVLTNLFPDYDIVLGGDVNTVLNVNSEQSRLFR